MAERKIYTYNFVGDIFVGKITERGILIVGEFTLDRKGNFINIPTKQEMLKTAEIEVNHSHNL
jgi:hypothetical protein